MTKLIDSLLTNNETDPYLKLLCVQYKYYLI